jgi:FKBP-type peptidyl-prolyl cis-trans isomerase FkpA
MRKVFTFFVAVLIFAACKKQHNGGCVPATPSSESASIASFCLANGINATTDSNGIYYQIIDQGSGSKANMNSVITVTYSTSLLDGQMIDTTHFITPVTLPLNQFIEGWRIAIPYIQEGGHIKMVIPSSLAYGCTGIQNLVPSNAPLYYDVFLLDVSH